MHTLEIRYAPIPTVASNPERRSCRCGYHQPQADAAHRHDSTACQWPLYLVTAGLRVLRKIEHIIREEMNRSGAQEVSMPLVQPAELWIETGRWQKMGDEMMRLQDRHKRDFCLGPTHEEVITDLFRREVHSYRQLPVNFYQIQTKFRDERRPRFGVMRAREFTMKDAYSFHLDQASFDATYEEMYRCYERILTRMQLEFRAVQADTGNIGGDNSTSFTCSRNLAKTPSPTATPAHTRPI